MNKYENLTLEEVINLVNKLKGHDFEFSPEWPPYAYILHIPYYHRILHKDPNKEENKEIGYIDTTRRKTSITRVGNYNPITYDPIIEVGIYHLLDLSSIGQKLNLILPAFESKRVNTQ